MKEAVLPKTIAKIFNLSRDDEKYIVEYKSLAPNKPVGVRESLAALLLSE